MDLKGNTDTFTTGAADTLRAMPISPFSLISLSQCKYFQIPTSETTKNKQKLLCLLSTEVSGLTKGKFCWLVKII